MDDGFDNIGAAITGGLAARAVEPEHGEGREGPGETSCANCSTPLVGTHCHLCGQKAHVHRSLAAILHDIIHGVLHLDGKFWRTLPLLVWRPGELTRRYAHGERAKFVSPMGMFLFSVFVMFAVFSVYGLSLANIDLDAQGAGESVRTQLETRLTDAQAEREQLIALGPGNAERAEDIERLDQTIEDLETGISQIEELGLSETSGFTLIGDGMPSTGWNRLDYGIQKLNDNPSLALYKLQANGFKFSWLLIPVSVPFVWILFFWTRRFRMYDHTVFVTYSLAFMSLFAIALTLLGLARLDGSIITLAALFVPPVHIFRQLKGAYRLHWVTALFRTIILTSFCLITASIFFLLLLAIGALG